MVEGAAARILSAHANRNAGGDQAGKGQGLGHAVVDGALACRHLLALFEQGGDLGMDVEVGAGIRQVSCPGA